MLNKIEILESQIELKKIQLETLCKEIKENLNTELIKHVDTSELTDLGLSFEVEDDFDTLIIKVIKGNGFNASYIYQNLNSISYENKLSLSTNLNISRFDPTYENEKDDIKLFKNHFFIKQNYKNISEWFENNLKNAIEEINIPIIMIELEIESSKALLEVEAEILFKYEVNQLYYNKRTEIESPIILKRNWDYTDYVNLKNDEMRVHTISYSKIIDCVSVKIKGENDKGYKHKNICGIRNCESIGRDRWECEYGELDYSYSNGKRTYFKNWECGIISDSSLREYCESVVSSKVLFNKNLKEPIRNIREEFIPTPIQLDTLYHTTYNKLLTNDELDCIINGEFEIDENELVTFKVK